MQSLQESDMQLDCDAASRPRLVSTIPTTVDCLVVRHIARLLTGMLAS